MKQNHTLNQQVQKNKYSIAEVGRGAGSRGNKEQIWSDEMGHLFSGNP